MALGVAAGAVPRADLADWLDGTIAEALLLALDPGLEAWCAGRTQRAADPPYPELPTLYARARVHRVAAVSALLSPTRGAGDRVSERRRDVALVDFARCGAPHEVLLTRAITAAARTLLTGADPFEDLERVEAATAPITAGDPTGGPALIALLRGAAAVTAGDLAVARAALERVAAGTADGDATRPVAAAFLALSRDELDLAGVIDELERAGRGRHPIVGRLHVLAAHALADRGDVGALRHVDASTQLAPAAEVDVVERRLLRHRAALLAGTPVPTGELVRLLEDLAAFGRRRPAAVLALRLAADHDRGSGPGAAADELRVWARRRLPPPAGRTVWEHLWAGSEEPSGRVVPTGPETSAPSGDDGVPSAAAPSRIDVLAPAVGLEVDGDVVPLRPHVAKLLLALIVAHPAALAVEDAVDLLWPDAAPGDGRPRLHTVLHRVRVALRPTGASVVREADRLRFRPGTCTVDLLAYREGLTGDAARRWRSLSAVRGNLADAQFPYDDHLVHARHAFLATWTEAARRLVADEGMPAADLAAASGALGVALGS